ncbi:hypothetical protein KIH41_13155 [Litoribacter ruber]|uniref:hypothetical protein n=1 Tax=Litoribacter ruber TaxID=702568 RepID=UPI001BDACC6C|nr:hypothetical protein [Litoribacter ruber]MBT0812227.1 hypothetical protein [Litoribacter ruber]
MDRFLFFLIGFVLISQVVSAQSAYLPFDRDKYHLIERYEIRNGEFSPDFNTGFKPYRRDRVVKYLDSLTVQNQSLGKVDAFNLQYLRDDSWEFSGLPTTESEKPLWGIYRKPSDFYHYRDRFFDLHVNPVISLGGGVERGQEDLRFINSRGIELRGSVDRKIGFYTFMTMNEVVFPTWMDAYTRENGAVPGEGFWKFYEQNGFSYFSALGHLSFNITKHVQAQVGHDRNFVGEGNRSLILSDFSNPFMFFKINTKIWKLDFTNMWGQMTADLVYDGRGRPTDARFPQKWFSHHRLGINIGNKFNVGVFESVMANSWDWSYANPVIFYRWVEHMLGTPDKVMLGTDFKWNFYPAMQLYGQFALDEFVFGEFFGIDGENSRRNKHGVQLGYKYVDAFKISNLDFQVEYNQVRPYTYQEKFEYGSFTNYRTPLTHPRGANFREGLAIVRYQPMNRLFLNLTGMYQLHGSDPSPEVNYGGDVNKNHNITNVELGLFGHTIGQGVKNEIYMGTMRASYMWKHNLFVDLSQTFRQQQIEGQSNLSTSFTQMGIRLNFGLRDQFL